MYGLRGQDLSFPPKSIPVECLPLHLCKKVSSVTWRSYSRYSIRGFKKTSNVETSWVGTDG